VINAVVIVPGTLATFPVLVALVVVEVAAELGITQAGLRALLKSTPTTRGRCVTSPRAEL
jgi:hypothetical protein